MSGDPEALTRGQLAAAAKKSFDALLRDHIAEHRHSRFWKSFDDFLQAAGVVRFSHCTLFYAKHGDTLVAQPCAFK